ncbi:50S ribosomal protein L3 [Puniceicoccales bacterium CK1056]|uniref:Large ribosomal subunit protein uL3 n=1 Tax=Oceanipulchritudo coccoides TaxID=2706888 RepID=A0A6B2M1P5_9BACT|nr:50S ribosomal protein L3 [Oceanipulchritudo coccoides]NDV62643.1 50S ribosomal protein L3 [Oceanipulchritudo coccoides]
MSTALIGKKVGMTQVYIETGELVPVTVIEAGPCPVVQVKNQEKDGYSAIQIGFGSKKEKNTSNGAKGHFKKAGSDPQRFLREIRLTEDSTAEAGSSLTVEIFQDDAKVDVIGETKGRGFQGVVKRWNFAGGPASHGSMFHRRGGSYGMCQWPGKVIKGKKMPGQFGTHRRTVQNLKIVKILPEKNLILVKGSVPGATGSTVLVRKAIKAKASA